MSNRDESKLTPETRQIFSSKQSGENSRSKFLWKQDVFELNEMEGKLFDDMPSAPKAPRFSKDFDLHGELNGDESTVQDPKVLIPILMALVGLILLVVANQIFGVEMSDVQSLLGDSTSTITNALAGIWTSASEVITNLPDTIKNLLPF